MGVCVLFLEAANPNNVNTDRERMVQLRTNAILKNTAANFQCGSQLWRPSPHPLKKVTKTILLPKKQKMLLIKQSGVLCRYIAYILMFSCFEFSVPLGCMQCFHTASEVYPRARRCSCATQVYAHKVLAAYNIRFPGLPGPWLNPPIVRSADMPLALI